MDIHDSLLGRWESLAQREIVLDGIFDDRRWAVAPHRILFILKDAYDAENPDQGWDLRAYARQEGFKGVTLREMSHWAYALLNPSSCYPCNDDKELHDALLSIASINVKKVPGNTYANDDELKAHADLFGDLLKEQIEIINPSIVICGSTWWAISHLFEVSRVACSTGRIFRTHGCRVFLDFWHPANRFPRFMNCSALLELTHRANALAS